MQILSGKKENIPNKIRRISWHLLKLKPSPCTGAPLHRRRMAREVTSSSSRRTAGTAARFVASPTCGFALLYHQTWVQLGGRPQPPAPCWARACSGRSPLSLVASGSASPQLPAPRCARGLAPCRDLAAERAKRGGNPLPWARRGVAARSPGRRADVPSCCPCAGRCAEVSRYNMGSWTQGTKEADVREPGEYLAHPAISRLNICNFCHKKFTSCRSQ